jgi:hypothetical protein
MNSQKRYRSQSIDDDLDNFTDYIYNGNLSFCKYILNGIKNLICPCFCRKRKQSKTTYNVTV